MSKTHLAFCSLLLLVAQVSAQEVIVVGAGTSGLATARTLVDHGGYNVTVLEANPDRYGGRIWTNREIISDGSAMDLGASFISGSSRLNPIRQIADEIGVDLVPAIFINAAGWDEETGEQFTPLELLDVANNFTAIMTNLYEASRNYTEDTSLYGAAEIEGLLPEWLHPNNQMFLCAWETSSGAPQNNMSVLLLDAYWNTTTYPGLDVIFPNGYVDILDYLVEGNSNINVTQIPLDIRLGQTVTNINIDDVTERVEVVTSNGDVYFADAVVVTASLGILKSGQINFSPPLPEDKEAAIDRLGFGILNKVVLEFDEPFWSNRHWFLLAENNLEDSSVGTLFMNLQAVLGKPILLAFAGGQDAIDSEDMTDDEVIQITIDHLSSIVGYDVTTNHTLVSSARTRWYNNPYTLGSYSFPAVGGSADDWDLMSIPVCPAIYFAGEHTNPGQYGTVHGAYSSGLRAAQQIIDDTAC